MSSSGAWFDTDDRRGGGSALSIGEVAPHKNVQKSVHKSETDEASTHLLKQKREAPIVSSNGFSLKSRLQDHV